VRFYFGTFETTEKIKILQCTIAPQRYAIHPLTDAYLNRHTHSRALSVQRATSQHGTDCCKQPFSNIKTRGGVSRLLFVAWSCCENQYIVVRNQLGRSVISIKNLSPLTESFQDRRTARSESRCALIKGAGSQLKRTMVSKN
jgi:hypothetical protein